MYKEVSDQFINKIYETYMNELAKDPVPNIRFNFSKTAKLIHYQLDNTNKMSCFTTLKNLSENDTDFDVKFYSQQAMEQFPQFYRLLTI